MQALKFKRLKLEVYVRASSHPLGESTREISIGQLRVRQAARSRAIVLLGARHRTRRSVHLRAPPAGAIRPTERHEATPRLQVFDEHSVSVRMQERRGP